MQDIHVVPNYAKFFSESVDRNFGCSFKNDFAKLQFTMEAVSVDDYRHPVGVKMTCRRFVQDIYPNANKLVLAVLSFLLAKRVGGLQKIVLTRLPVSAQYLFSMLPTASTNMHHRRLVIPMKTSMEFSVESRNILETSMS